MASKDTNTDVFGWDLLYSLYDKQLTKKQHIAVIWTHYILIRRGFKNCGIGDDQSLPSNKELKETLPVGWNNQEPSRLRYFYNKRLYFLTVQDFDEEGDMLINLHRPCDGQLSMGSISVKDVLKLSGTLDEILPDWLKIMQRLNDELIDPLVLNDASKDVTVQTDPVEESSGRSRVQRDVSDIDYLPPRPLLFRPSVGVGVGSADLDPLGGGGGMLFQPPGMPHPGLPDPLLPQGSVPPGARFDPIMPNRGGIPRHPRGPMRPQQGPRPGYPDPDHLPPPGYDDMFS